MKLLSSHLVNWPAYAMVGVGFDDALAQQGHALARVFLGVENGGARHRKLTRGLGAGFAGGDAALLRERGE